MKTEKQCRDCGQVKPLSEYYFYLRDAKFYDRCKECHKVRVKKNQQFENQLREEFEAKWAR